jgi:NADH dehydrogenase [ubiquinone] 1 alpha subcomplex assembly factor 7
LGPLTQGAFLERMAIAQRVQSLIRSAATPERAQAIEDAAKRLVDPSGMGGEYKILGVVGRASDELPREIGEIYPFEGLAEVEPATKV